MSSFVILSKSVRDILIL